MKNEKIIFFGAGHKKEILTKFIENYGGFDIVEIWDNNRLFWGEETLILNKRVPITQPHSLQDYPVVISSDAYFDEIKKQLIFEFGIKESLIKPSQYLFKNFKDEIISRYRDSSDQSIIGICNYLKNHEIDMFNGQVKKEYPGDMFDILRDEVSGLLYSYWMGKKIYLKSEIKSEAVAKEYLCLLCKEQDNNSPHCYSINKLNLTEDDVVVDAGAAEGFFSLQIVDQVKKIYLVESNREWLEALKYTFAPYSQKIVIVPKWLGSKNDESTISIDQIDNKDNIGKAGCRGRRDGCHCRR